MKEHINTELLKLQEELGTLNTAVQEISKAGKVSEDLINSTQHIHLSYQDQLNKIQKLYSEFLNKTYNHTEKNISKIFTHFKEKIREEEKILEKYTELSLQTEDLTHEYLKTNFNENKKQILGLISDADKNFEGQKTIIELYAKSVENQITKVVESHKERLDEEEKILSNYLELAQLTAELTEQLRQIDFPKRLDFIEKYQKMGHDVIEELNNNKTNDMILELVQKQNKKLKKTNLFLTVFFVLNFIVYGFAGALSFNLIKDFITNLF